MNFFDRLGQLVVGAKAQWIGRIQYGRATVLGPTLRAMTSSATCDTCRGPLRANGGIVHFCGKLCRHARHHAERFRRERLKAWAAKPAR